MEIKRLTMFARYNSDIIILDYQKKKKKILVLISMQTTAIIRNKAYQSLKEGCSNFSQEISEGQIFLFLEANELVLLSPILRNG